MKFAEAYAHAAGDAISMQTMTGNMQISVALKHMIAAQSELQKQNPCKIRAPLLHTQTNTKLHWKPGATICAA